MAIKDLQPRQGKVDIVVEVVEKGEVREFDKFGKTGRVCNATVKDETGETKLTLWNEQIDQVNAGDKVHITNGYVGEYQGEMQLTTGKFGQLEVVGQSETAEKPEEKKEEKPAEEKKPEPKVEETPVEEEKIE
jgi:replication factor A1